MIKSSSLATQAVKPHRGRCCLEYGRPGKTVWPKEVQASGSDWDVLYHQVRRGLWGLAIGICHGPLAEAPGRGPAHPSPHLMMNCKEAITGVLLGL